MSAQLPSSMSIADLLRVFEVERTAAAGSLLAAARAYADAVRRFGNTAREEFAARFPSIGGPEWSKILAIGNGEMDPRLLSMTSTGHAYVRRISPSAQREALDQGVPVCSPDGSHLRVAVENLTPFQCRQVFAGQRVRSLEEQRAWLSSATAQARRQTPARRVAHEPVKAGIQYTGPDGKPHVIPWSDVARWMADRLP